MYVPIVTGLLEFDGASWNLYPIRNAKARAMRIGNDGRIYIGGIEGGSVISPQTGWGLDYHMPPFGHFAP